MKCPYCELAGKTPCLHSERLLEDMIQHLRLGHSAIQLYETMQNAIECYADEVTSSEQQQSEQNYDITELVEWLKTHEVRQDSDRNSKLFKNIAIWMVNSGMSWAEMGKLDAEITKNCPGRRKGEIVSWIPWVKRGSEKKVNINELMSVAKKQGYSG